MKIQRRRPRPAQYSLETEVERYLNDRLAPVETSSLSWWQVSIILSNLVSHFVYASLQENSDRYPTIFRLAMDILPIQGSAVPCECVFSSAKETMTPRRNRITSDLMEALQLLKFSVKKGRGLNFTSGLDHGAALADLEAFMTAENKFPEDVHSYSKQLIPSGGRSNTSTRPRV